MDTMVNHARFMVNHEKITLKCGNMVYLIYDLSG